MKAAEARPSTRKTPLRKRKVPARFRPVSPRKRGARILLMKRAPSPKPMTTIPVASPFLSGNHLETVATGVTYPRPSPMPPITP